MDNPFLLWSVFGAIIFAILFFDLGILNRRDHEIKPRESMYLSLFYFVLACSFGGGVFHFMGAQQGYEFFTGYLIELSLSFDNLFVFVLIFTYFGVPPKYQHRVLFWGILGALIMRGIFISLGTAIIHEFDWVMYIFGVFLIYTGIKMLIAADKTPDMKNNKIISFLRRNLRVTKGFKEQKFFVREKGKLWFTPLFLVLILVEISDLIFAVDSIPAIFAVTTNPFIVYTSNVFAILGLRSLYFALAYFIHRFEYLKYGLSLILIIIGGKILINHHFQEKIIPIEIALALTILILISSALLSIYKTRGTKPQIAGWVPGSDSKEEKPKKKK